MVLIVLFVFFLLNDKDGRFSQLIESDEMANHNCGGEDTDCSPFQSTMLVVPKI